ncbi:MAG: hypothetical protein ACTJHU_01770 [Mycetocola sp.]
MRANDSASQTDDQDEARRAALLHQVRSHPGATATQLTLPGMTAAQVRAGLAVLELDGRVSSQRGRWWPSGARS